MDVVEAGLLGVRAAVSQLARRETPLRFTIYPMVHLAEPAFYAEVSRRLRDHDLIVAEGINGPAGSHSTVSRLTQAYRLASASERLGLVGQTRAVYEVGVPILWADMSGAERPSARGLSDDRAWLRRDRRGMGHHLRLLTASAATARSHTRHPGTGEGTFYIRPRINLTPDYAEQRIEHGFTLFTDVPTCAFALNLTAN